MAYADLREGVLELFAEAQHLGARRHSGGPERASLDRPWPMADPEPASWPALVRLARAAADAAVVLDTLDLARASEASRRRKLDRELAAKREATRRRCRAASRRCRNPGCGVLLLLTPRTMNRLDCSPACTRRVWELTNRPATHAGPGRPRHKREHG